MNYPLMVWSLCSVWLWFGYHPSSIWEFHVLQPSVCSTFLIFFFFYGLICDNIQDFQCGLRLSDLTLCPDISVSLIWLFLSQKLLIRTLLLITSAFIVFLIPFDTPPIITDWPVTCFSFEAQRKFIMHTCKTNWSRPIVFSLLPYSNSKYSMGLNLMESNRNLVIGI